MSLQKKKWQMSLLGYTTSSSAQSWEYWEYITKAISFRSLDLRPFIPKYLYEAILFVNKNAIMEFIQITKK